MSSIVRRIVVRESPNSSPNWRSDRTGSPAGDTAFTSMLPPLIDAGTLAPLEQCIADGGLGDRLLPSVSFAQVDGKTYGVPLTMSP